MNTMKPYIYPKPTIQFNVLSTINKQNSNNKHTKNQPNHNQDNARSSSRNNKSDNSSLNGSRSARNPKLELIIKNKISALYHNKLQYEDLNAYRNEIEYRYNHSKSNQLFIFPIVITEDKVNDFLQEEDESEGILNEYLITIPSTIYYKRDAGSMNTPVSKLKTLSSTATKDSAIKSYRSTISSKKGRNLFGRNMMTYRAYEPAKKVN